MTPNAVEYYRQCARVERTRALETTIQRAAAIHLEVADLYDQLIRLYALETPLHIMSGTRRAV
jgi:hypothetical protein